jgi:hypothetical protein
MLSTALLPAAQAEPESMQRGVEAASAANSQQR